MKLFAALYRALDETTRTSLKEEALVAYFRAAPPEDAAWGLWFLSGGRPKRLVSAPQLREWAAREAGLPSWLVEESYDVVGDLAETVAHLLDGGGLPRREWALHRLVSERLEPLAGAVEERRRELLVAAWRELPDDQRLLWNKLITGGFRVGVGRGLLVRALAAVSGAAPAQIAHRLSGPWHPSAAAFAALLEGDAAADPGRPYPFFLASSLEVPPDGRAAALGAAQLLGEVEAWQAEWKWDGVRAQLLRRAGATLLWSRGDELVTHRFPEVVAAAGALPDGVVLDGELLAWSGDGPLPFGELQRRLGRERVDERLLAEVPVRFMVHDLLELGGEDWRERPLVERRAALRELLAAVPGDGALLLSPVLPVGSWEELATLRDGARGRAVEGLMLKRLASPYRAGRPRGDWWKWKVEPFSVDAVLVYAQRGQGKRASLYTDYTFAVWERGELVPIGKATSGLSDAEIADVDRWVRRNIVERFGPVRQVRPELVFELAFDGVQRSGRHKSGLALRFPRIARWRRDKRAEEGDTLDELRALIERAEASGARHTLTGRQRPGGSL